MFKKATKQQAKLRCALFGTSGSGKTYSALRIAKGMGGKIALIDSERNSACKYSDRFDFDVADLDSKNIESYTNFINGAAKGGYNVLIIDSLSHAWQELLQEIELIAKSKYKGNTWSAWSEGTPKQKQLVNAILSYPGHIIATMRCKTEWSTQTTSKGTTRPVRVALAPEQGKGIEYEFDLLLELSTDHIANVIKDRTGKFQDMVIDKPGEDFGKQLIDWLSEGEELKTDTNTAELISTSQVKELQTLIQARDVDLPKLYKYLGIKSLTEVTTEQYDGLTMKIKQKRLKEAAEFFGPEDDPIPPESFRND